MGTTDFLAAWLWPGVLVFAACVVAMILRTMGSMREQQRARHELLVATIQIRVERENELRALQGEPPLRMRTEEDVVVEDAPARRAA